VVRVEWAPRAGETALAAVAALLVAGAAVVVPDTPGRLLLGLAALLLAGRAGRDVLLRPRLAAGPGGLEVRTLGGRRHLPWPLLRVRVRETRRFGVRARTLELDTATGPDDAGILVVLGRRELGEDPEDVARQLGELDPRTP
jgi:hypothetical protein